MGRDLYLDTKIITKEEYEKLKNGDFYINKHNLTLLSKNDIEQSKKSFLFNLISFIIENKTTDELNNILYEYKENNIDNDFYNWCQEKYQDFDTDDIDFYELDYDEDKFECYINFNDWIEQKDWEEGFLERRVEIIENSVVLIQANVW